MGKLGRIYNPHCSPGDAKAYALALIRVLQEHRQLTSHELWEQARAEGIQGSKRQFKQLLRWMKQEDMVSTSLPDQGAENRVYKVSDSIPRDGDDAGAMSRIDDAARRIPTPEKEFKVDLREIWLKNNAREPLSRYELRLQEREERRGLAPLMPFWDI